MSQYGVHVESSRGYYVCKYNLIIERVSKMAMAKNDDFTFEITRHIADLSEPTAKGWTLELNLVSWAGRPAQFDIRQWNEDHTRSSKGSTFKQEELMSLYEVLHDMFGELPSGENDDDDDDADIPASFDIP